jgi:hypothetical protein
LPEVAVTVGVGVAAAVDVVAFVDRLDVEAEPAALETTAASAPDTIAPLSVAADTTPNDRGPDGQPPQASIGPGPSLGAPVVVAVHAPILPRPSFRDRDGPPLDPVDGRGQSGRNRPSGPAVIEPPPGSLDSRSHP